MDIKLNEILVEEEKRLKELLDLLDKQHKFILKKDVFALESIVEEIKLKNKEIAEVEVERRKLLGNISIKDYVLKSNNENLDNNYRSIKRLLNEMIIQKDTNEILIKQQLSFTNKLLNIMNPKKEASVYNSYGNIRR